MAEINLYIYFLITKNGNVNHRPNCSFLFNLTLLYVCRPPLYQTRSISNFKFYSLFKQLKFVFVFTASLWGQNRPRVLYFTFCDENLKRRASQGFQFLIFFKNGFPLSPYYHIFKESLNFHGDFRILSSHQCHKLVAGFVEIISKFFISVNLAFHDTVLLT